VLFRVAQLEIAEALNTPIQSGAADIINEATIRIDERLEHEQLKSKMILQIHDQLVVETFWKEREKIKKILKEEMEKPVLIHGIKRIFPIDIETGPSLGELK
jgi:DNA polymerase-1